MCHSRGRRRVDLGVPHRDEWRDDVWTPYDEEQAVSAPAATRAGDSERDDVVELLGDAFADGRLTREEFDARSEAALAARTRGDLRALTRDLPPGLIAARRHARRRAEAAARAAGWLRAETGTYAGVMLLLLSIWLLVGLTAQSWYPWFVWPALGWGLAILVRAGRVSWRRQPPPSASPTPTRKGETHAPVRATAR